MQALSQRMPASRHLDHVLSTRATWAAYLRTPTLLRQLVVTVTVLAVFWCATGVSTIGVDSSAAAFCHNIVEAGGWNLTAFATGGATTRLSIVALSIYPLITSFIAWSLLSPVIPAWRHASTRTRGIVMGVFAVCFAGLSAHAVTTAAVNNTLMPGCTQTLVTGAVPPLVITVTLMAGAGLVAGLAVVINKFGIGNGFGLIIATGIAASIPDIARFIITTHGPAVLAVAVGVLVGEVALLARLLTRTTVLTAHSRDGAHTGTVTIPANPAGIMPLIIGSILAYAPYLLHNVFPDLPLLQTLSNNPIATYTLTAALITGLTFYFVISGWDSPTIAATLHDNGIILDTLPADTPDIDEATMRVVDSLLLTRCVRASLLLSAFAIIPAAGARALDLVPLVALAGPTLLVVYAIAVTTWASIRKRAATATGTPPAADTTWLLSGKGTRAVQVATSAPSDAMQVPQPAANVTGNRAERRARARRGRVRASTSPSSPHR